MVIQGSCLCGSIAFELEESHIVLFNKCNCTKCRKSSGSSYRAQLQVPTVHFRWIQGGALTSKFESSPGIHRAFCRICGSAVPQTTNEGTNVGVPAGLLDGDLGVRPEISMHTASKADWDTIDSSTLSISGQGNEEFWRDFMQRKDGGT